MRKTRSAAILLVLAVCGCAGGPAPAPAPQTIVLSGDLTGADHQSYLELPFIVPPGVTAITIELDYDRSNRTVVDMGLRDPDGQRGWSGGNKSTFTVSETEATPSYMRGAIQPGAWRLVLGVPNIREGQTSHYEATVTLTSESARSGTGQRADAPTNGAVLSREAGWRRGDFHTHTGHSDGACDDGSGTRAPCPLARTAEAAREAGLDFVAITDHNTLSHRGPMLELQNSLPGLLLVPGTEITTFHGHANAIGLSEPLEFQLGSARLPSVAALLDNVAAQHAFLSINHPRQPSGEVCMGCGWSAAETNWSRVDAIEIVNGASLRVSGAEGPTSGIPLWDDLLRQGHRITAIGGSDNHDATDRLGARQSPVGKPTTVVWANELSESGLIEGVRSGRVFIDLTRTPGALLDARGRSQSGEVHMGGVLALAPGEQGLFRASVEGVQGGGVHIASHKLVVEADGEQTSELAATLQLEPGASSGWIRAEVRDAAGGLLMIGNPIYVRSGS